MTNENIDDLRKILTAYGERQQMHMIVEECAELIKTISKIDREGRGAEEIKNYIEELADVTVLMKQLFLALSPSEQAEYYKVQHYKIERQLKRIEREPVCFTVDDEIEEAFHAGLKNSEMIGKIAICDLLTTINEQGIGGGCVLYAQTVRNALRNGLTRR